MVYSSLAAFSHDPDILCVVGNYVEEFWSILANSKNACTSALNNGLYLQM